MADDLTVYRWARVRRVLLERDQHAPGHPTPREIAQFADAKRNDDAVSTFINDYYYPNRFGGNAKLSETDAEALVRRIEGAKAKPAVDSTSAPELESAEPETESANLEPESADEEPQLPPDETETGLPGLARVASLPLSPKAIGGIVAVVVLLAVVAYMSQQPAPPEAIETSVAEVSIGLLSDDGGTLEPSAGNLSRSDVETITRERWENGDSLTFRFTPAGAAKMRALTEPNIGKALAFVGAGGVFHLRAIQTVEVYAVTIHGGRSTIDDLVAALRSRIPATGYQPLPSPRSETLLLHQFDSGKWAAVIGEHPDAMTLVIRSAAEWASFCSRHAFSSPELFDESKHVAVVVAIGRRDDEGDTVVIHPPELGAGSWIIPYSIKHESGVPNNGINTHPWTIAILQRTDADFDFRRIE